MHSGWWGLPRETNAWLDYDELIIFVRFSFCFIPFQYHNALPETQMRYRLLFAINSLSL